MKRKSIKGTMLFILCILGITSCSYFTQIQDKSAASISQTQGNYNNLPEESKDTSELSYQMDLYTEAPNQDSTIKVQYPVFSGNKAEEINEMVMRQVKNMVQLDLTRFPENTKETAIFQSAVTLQNSKIISMVFWGTTDLEGSQFPTTNLYSLNIDLQTLKLITLNDLYRVDDEFEKTFFEKAFFPTNPVTSYSEKEFSEMLKLQTPEFQSVSPFSNPEIIRCFLKPEGIVLSLFSDHASGSDHFEAELLYSDIQKCYLPEQNYWE